VDGESKNKNSYVVCGSIQSVSQNLYEFTENEFGYLVIDECHHGTAGTYQKVLSHFRPEFTLGLTATPERTDGNDLLEVFRNVAHKLDLKTAVELGELVPVRCIRIKTNIDLRDVRINGIRYNSQDLESKIFVPERSRIILETWLEFVRDKPTVIFCASVMHAGEIAALFREAGIEAEAVSGSTKAGERGRILAYYEAGKIPVLCACDLLNEGWDSPHTQVVFMARPTMSKTIYMQQLGRGMRNAPGKECLFVFDFVDNANLFNMPYSLHRLLNLNNYRPGELVLAPKFQREIDQALFAKGERPSALIDFPVSAMDYETVDLFNWQDEAKNMISQIELVRRVNVQRETIERYIREGRLIADLEVPLGDKRSFKYFREETLQRYAKDYGWTLITPQNMTQMFMDMVKAMDMSASYKPVLLKAFFEHMDGEGKVRLEDLVSYFIDYYTLRKEKSLPVEKATSIFAKGGYTEKEVERLILSNPFKRFEDMRFMKHSRQLGYVELNGIIYKRLSNEDKRWIMEWCDRKLDEYYSNRTF
jgi:superfamily II DNA or RNA helicase